MDKLKRIYTKYREQILYLLFGGLTTAVSWGSYALGVYAFELSATISNIFSWVAAVVFAFVTNKLFVFDSANKSRSLLYEIVTFVSCRIASGIVETLFLLLTVDLYQSAKGLSDDDIKLHSMIMKLIISVFVVIANYFLSKLIVFRKKADPDNSKGEDK